MTRLPSYNGTPLRQALDRAGQYLQTTGNMSPYADTIGSSSTTYASCRQSYSVVMTDGKWNSAGPYSTVGNTDSASTTMPDGTSFPATAPFRDNNSGSLADIVYVYLFKNDGAEFWMAWAFWDRVIKVVMFSVFAWMYHGAAKNAEERGSVPAKR